MEFGKNSTTVYDNALLTAVLIEPLPTLDCSIVATRSNALLLCPIGMLRWMRIRWLHLLQLLLLWFQQVCYIQDLQKYTIPRAYAYLFLRISDRNLPLALVGRAPGVSWPPGSPAGWSAVADQQSATVAPVGSVVQH